MPKGTGYAGPMRFWSSFPGRCLCLAFLFGAVTCVAGASTLYRWVDANGVIHYSDRPEPGAARIEVPPAQTYKGTPNSPSTAASAVRTPASAAVSMSYTSLTITTPEDGSVVWNATDGIRVSASLEPALVNGHQLWVIVDGTRQDAPISGLSMLVTLARGAHTIAAMVSDANGRELITSASVSLTVRQNSVAAPPQGPSLPQKPKPRGS